MATKTSFNRTAMGAAAILSWHMVASHAAPPSASMQVSSSSFSDGGTIPSTFTCDGSDLSPHLRLSTPPSGTKSLAIVVDDPDAPSLFTHWLAYNIPPETRELPEGASTSSHRLSHGTEGTNSFGQIGYGGPCPPPGKPHHYLFHVYALDINLTLPAGAQAEQVKAAIKGHVLAAGQITGLYARNNH